MLVKSTMEEDEMKWLGCLTVSVLLLLTGCSEPRAGMKEVEEQIIDVVNTNFEESGISEYISGDIELFQVDKDQSETLTFYSYNVKVEAKDEFASSSNEEIYKELMDTSELFKMGNFDCGENSKCRVDTISMVNGEDTYEVQTQFNINDEISINGELYKPEEEVVESVESSQEDGTYTGEGNSKVDETEVYEFMKSAYDEITNYGANYVPEIHDPQVATLASDRFGITTKEADQIYIDFEMNKAGY